MIVNTKLDNGLEIIQNFEWNMTKRKLCIFMPNYHDKKYTQFSIDNIKTTIPKDDYIIIVGNDGDYIDFDNMENENVFFFSLKRKEKTMRNGCFIRNYIIKRCQSDLFFQKDGEVVVLGDFIKSCIRSNGDWRAGKIYVLDDDNTNEFMMTGNSHVVTSKPPTKIINPIFPDTVEDVKKIIFDSNGKQNLSTYHHYSYCVKTELLKSIRGYDEDYYYYGFEDSDMFCRLYHLGHKLIPDPSITAVHLCHPREEITSEINIMGQLFKDKNPINSIRNSTNWGDGI